MNLYKKVKIKINNNKYRSYPDCGIFVDFWRKVIDFSIKNHRLLDKIMLCSKSITEIDIANYGDCIFCKSIYLSKFIFLFDRLI